MTSISPLTGANAAWAVQANPAAAQAAKPIDRDGDRDNNKQEAPLTTVKVGTTPVNKLDMKV
jgi:hypothetical protein